MNLIEAEQWLNSMKEKNDGLRRVFDPVRPEDVMIVENMLDYIATHVHNTIELTQYVNRVSELFSKVLYERFDSNDENKAS